MARKRNNRKNSKKQKLSGREHRLAHGPDWLASYKGNRNRLIKRYRKAFGIDWECAIVELEEQGITHDSAYLAELRRSIASQIRSEKRWTPISRWEFDAYHGIEPNSDEHFAYIAGYTPGGFPFGVSWEEWENYENEGSNEQIDAEDAVFLGTP